MQRLSPRTLTSLVIAERMRAERAAHLALKAAREKLDFSSLRELECTQALAALRSLSQRLLAAALGRSDPEKKIPITDPKTLRPAEIAADFSQPIPGRNAGPHAPAAFDREPEARPLTAAELCLFADAAAAARGDAEAAYAELLLAREQHKQAAHEVDLKEGEWRLATGRRKAAERHQAYQRRDEKRLRAQLVRDQEEEARDRYASSLRQHADRKTPKP